MNNLNDYLSQAKRLDNDKPLFVEEELNLILIKKEIKFPTIIKTLIMSFACISLFTTLAYFLFFGMQDSQALKTNDGNSGVNKISSVTLEKGNAILASNAVDNNSSSNNKDDLQHQENQINVMMVKENTSQNEELNSNGIASATITKNQAQTFTSGMYINLDTGSVIIHNSSGTFIAVSSKNNNKLPTYQMGGQAFFINIEDTNKKKEPVSREEAFSRCDIPGIRMLELNDEEMKNFHIERNENTIKLFIERQINKYDEYLISRYISAGYFPLFVPSIIRTYILHGNKSTNRFDIQSLAPKEKLDRMYFSKSLYVAYHNFDKRNNIRSSGINPCSPLFQYGEGSFKEFYEKYWILENERYKTYEKMLTGQNYPLLHEEWLLQTKRIESHEKTIYDQLIPVLYYPTLANGDSLDSYFVLWFVPNDEFIEKLPERYRNKVREELSALNKVQQEGMPLAQACKGQAFEDSYYGFCRLSAGAYEILSILPNPVSDEATCRTSTAETRFLNIRLHSIDGRCMGDIDNNVKISAGINDIPINLARNELASGFYLISFSSEKGEIATKRIYYARK
ncbi:MAG: hypothetical protein HW421_661 [Ignavibacteria bacterium]|nr:hypothetical protein [Ignavibacteria bacterium]